MTSSGPQLSRVRTILFGVVACIWFGEMVFLGFRPLSDVWTQQWQVVPPEDPRLLAALSVVWAVASPAKGALFVMAVLGMRSRIPSVRTALYASMALIPPLNIAFPFRQQGFLLKPVAVATTLSVVFWGAFFLFRERAPRAEAGRSAARSPSGWERVELVWFAAYSTALSLLALLLLFQPRNGLALMLPCLSSVMNTHEGELSGLVHSAIASGTHLAAIAIASWIATVDGRRTPELRKAMALAGTVHAGLFAVFPLRQIVVGFGTDCATSSVLIAFVPLFAGWVLWAIVEARRTRRTHPAGAQAVGGSR